ncbi:hypothetical protein BGZ49_002280, partial [Haplosporangium sp. Z 27]
SDPMINTEDIEQKLFHPTMEHGKGSVVVWGYVTWDDPGFLANIESTLVTKLCMMTLSEDPWDNV